ncbi:MAG: BglI family type II restriction endonuclease, partial [Armatimonadetes bacterium]|nr:BglI family type II restriction endonuclease [Armatimonadota bacterium]
MTHNGKDYQFHRQRLLDDIDSLIALEQKYMEFLLKATLQAASTLHTDFCRANDLIPFWIKYAPKQRGRKPTGTSIPWSEVGEKSLAPNLLLFDGPYYAKTPGLLIPGKDDKTKAEEDKRIRVRLDPLASL